MCKTIHVEPWGQCVTWLSIWAKYIHLWWKFTLSTSDYNARNQSVTATLLSWFSNLVQLLTLSGLTSKWVISCSGRVVTDWKYWQKLFSCGLASSEEPSIICVCCLPWLEEALHQDCGPAVFFTSSRVPPLHWIKSRLLIEN